MKQTIKNIQTNKQSTVMKNLFNILVLVATIFISQSVDAKSTYTQQDTSDAEVMMFGAAKAKKVATGAFGEMVANSKSTGAFFDLADKVDADTPEFVRQAKPLAVDYNGYTIELMTVYNKALSVDDALFQNFGGITYTQKTANSYTYYLGSFQTKKALVEYMNNIVKPRYANATAVKFKKGQEVRIK